MNNHVISKQIGWLAMCSENWAAKYDVERCEWVDGPFETKASLFAIRVRHAAATQTCWAIGCYDHLKWIVHFHLNQRQLLQFQILAKALPQYGIHSTYAVVTAQLFMCLNSSVILQTKPLLFLNLFFDVAVVVAARVNREPTKWIRVEIIRSKIRSLPRQSIITKWNWENRNKKCFRCAISCNCPVSKMSNWSRNKRIFSNPSSNLKVVWARYFQTIHLAMRYCRPASNKYECEIHANPSTATVQWQWAVKKIQWIHCRKFFRCHIRLVDRVKVHTSLLRPKRLPLIKTMFWIQRSSKMHTIWPMKYVDRNQAIECHRMPSMRMRN